MRLLDVHDLALDLASLTGESEAIAATVAATDANYMQSRNMAFFGTSVVSGKVSGPSLEGAPGTRAIARSCLS